jgi:exodeoxyribonuclease V beta subunit
MECVDFRTADACAAAAEAERLMPQYGIDLRWREAFARAVCATLNTPLDASGLRLRDLDPARCLRELPFLHPVARIAPAALNRVLGRGPHGAPDPEGPAQLVFDPMHGFLKGYIDLVFEAGGRIYILDYKSNLLGPSPDDYRPDRLAREMATADYDLQVALYCVAVRRLLLSRGWEAADFDSRFGGAFYLFVRGLTPADGPARGVHFTRPEPARIAELSGLFDPTLRRGGGRD